MQLGPVHLTVADLHRSTAWYRDVVGLALIDRPIVASPPPRAASPPPHAAPPALDAALASPRAATQTATLGVGEHPLLVLIEEPHAEPVSHFSGLYHFALLLPNRFDLAQWLAHAIRERIQLTGASDHFVSEALYLSDPDGHGIEIYADRPRHLWEGQVAQRMTTLPLHTQSLLHELSHPADHAFARLPPGTTIGHIHLRVAHIPPSIAFYRDVLGLDLVAQLGTHAAFLSEDGYHHHIGVNTWESAGEGQPPPHHATLRRATLVMPPARLRQALHAASKVGIDVVEEDGASLLHDPSGNPIVLSAEVH